MTETLEKSKNREKGKVPGVKVAKFFTLMIIPQEEKKVRRFRIKRGVLSFAVCVGLLFLTTFSFLTYSFLNNNFDQQELQRLQVENVRQRRDLQQLTLDLKSLQGEMVYLTENEARIRQLADLDKSPQTVPIAVGGMPELDEPVELGSLQQRINQLQLAIDLRRQSQEDARSLLNDQVSLSRATPKGWPTKGWITSYFGMRQNPFGGRKRLHEGLDVAANTGTPVHVTADGIVARVEYSTGYGKTVIIDHGYGYRTLYAHNSRFLVKPGQRVARGTKIAEVGNTGISTGPHLHYEIQLNGIPIDPRKSL